jgi:predicted AAA+ superfamily ATPase
MVWIDRQLEGPLARLAKQRPVVVLTGARQTGKTSLVRRVFPAHGFVSLDLPSEAEQAEKDPRGFLARHPPPLILDEVQYAPRVFRHLKAQVDAARQRNGQFILTGSQKLVLMAEVSESLAGRAAVLELEGLSFAEIARAVPSAGPAAVGARGTLPELWEKQELEADEFWRSYVTTYLERDLRSLLAVSSLRDYERFVRACALRSAQLLNKAELARDVGVSPSTAGQWLSILEASNQVFLLEPWFSNRTKTLVKTPKLYLGDPGLLCFLAGIHGERELLASPLAGAVWETLVCAELRRALRNRRREGDLFFWRDRTREVDFLVHRGGRFDLYEAKWTEHPDARDAASLARVAGELGARNVTRRAIVCRSQHAYPVGDGIEAVPLGALS